MVGRDVILTTSRSDAHLVAKEVVATLKEASVLGSYGREAVKR